MESVSTATPSPSTSLLTAYGTGHSESSMVNTLSHYQIIRRNGAVFLLSQTKLLWR